MQLILEQSFIKSSEKLPQPIKLKLAKLLELLEERPQHPLLHTKSLKGDLRGFFSFRITREWRVIFYFKDSNTLHLLKAVHRKEAYR